MSTSPPPSNIKNPFKDMLFNDSVQYIGEDYEVYSALLQSPKGGVYFAKNKMHKNVVVKEARKWTGYDNRGFDSRTRLALEFITLLRIKGVRGTPNVSDFFIQDGNAYLVQEYLAGKPLLDWLISSYKTEEDIDLNNLLRSIRKLVHTLHKHQIIHRDISPNNILVTDESNVSLIDMEFSIYEPLEIFPVKSGTPGYTAPWVKDGVIAETKDDWFAVDQIMFTINTLSIPPKTMLNSSKIKLLDYIHSTDSAKAFYNSTFCVGLAINFIENELRKEPEKNWDGPGASWSLHNGLAGIVLVGSLLQIHLPQYSIKESTISKYVNTLHESMNNTILQVNGLHFGPGGVGLSTFLAGVAWGHNDWKEKGIYMIIKSCEAQLHDPKHFDWTHGGAGLLHTALIVYNSTNDSRFFNLIRRLEIQILRSNSYKGNSLYWESKLDGSHYTGFAHGIAGIGYVLNASFRVTKNIDARAAVLNIYDTLSATQNNSMWKTSVEDKEAQFFWCHGSPGIIHFLVSMMSCRKSALKLADQAALKMRFMNGMSPLNRCHGIVSLTAAYHDLYQATNKDDYKENEISTLFFINALRESVESGPGWIGDMFKIDNPSLMTGSLGVAYSILQERYNLPDPILLREYLPK